MIAKAIQGFTNNNLIKTFKENNKSKIFIYPNFSGLFLGLFIFFCFLISVFYENNFGLLISIIIFFIFFISIFISHQNLNYLNIVAQPEYFIQNSVNEKIDIQIINNSKEKKLNIDIDYNLKNIDNYNFFKKINTIKKYIFYKERGKYKLNRFTLKSIYPFGIIRTKRNFDLESNIYVYPKIIKPTQDLLNEFNLDNSNNLNNDFDGIEEYKRGDSYSQIAWKKSTFKEKKYVKKFLNPNVSQKTILDLNKYSKIPFELLLSYATFIIFYYFKNKLHLTIKHRDYLFDLNENKNSLNKILKYLSNVQS